MKVRELINELLEMDENAEVILQKDSEGNSYSPLAGTDHDVVYIPETTWFGEVYSTKWTHDDACMELEDWNEILNKPRCVVLYPIN